MNYVVQQEYNMSMYTIAALFHIIAVCLATLLLFSFIS